MRLPVSSTSARTLPNAEPATRLSPTPKSAVLDHQRGNSPATALQVRVDDRPHGTAARIRLRLDQDVGDGQHAFQEIVDAFPGPGARPHDRHIASVRLLGNDAALGELLERAIRVHTFLVDLVHRHDDGYTRGVDVLDGLLGLRHDPVIGGHDQNRHVGHVGSAGAHRRERPHGLGCR